MRIRALLLVFVGGAVGTAARAALDAAMPKPGGFPLAILLINVVGALLLGVLLEALLRPVPEPVAVADLRLLLGTGVMGGFTTYSTLALGAVELVHGGRPGLGIGYLVLSVLLGIGASTLGILIGGRLRPRRGEA